MKNEKNIRISVQDYGPIAEAKNIELCPLTVFVGPSNTGKSYLATLVYALFKGFENSHNMMGLRNRTLMFGDMPMAQGEDGSMEKMLKGNAENLNPSDFSKETKEWMHEEILRVLSRNFHKEISRCMGMSQAENGLIGEEFSVTLEDGKKRLTLSPSNTASSIEIKWSSIDKRPSSRLRRYVGSESKFSIGVQALMLITSVLGAISHSYEGSNSFYLPAARTGIMQSHRAIAGSLVRRASIGASEGVSIPTLSGIVSDFLQEVILLETDNTPDANVAQVAQSMEKNILHGSIIVKGSGENLYPQFAYKQNGLEVPLLRASSMVSELAPVVLFLRYKVRKGDLIIIEEPESHLHPAAQRDITKTIVQLVRAGVRVMVTTHSDYVLEQLSNHVRRSNLKDKKKPFLDESEIGAYSFTPETKGTVVKRLKFTNEDGLSPDDHDRVSSDSYNETVEILDQLDQEKQEKK